MKNNKEIKYRNNRLIFLVTIITVVALLELIMYICKIDSKNNLKNTTVSELTCIKNSNIKIEQTQEEISAIPSPKVTPTPSAIVNLTEANANRGGSDTSKQTTIDKNYKNFFKDDLFVGDSITDELPSYQLINRANACSKIGLTLSKAKAQIDTAQISEPRNIYILMGLNDLTEDTLTTKTYINQYIDVVNYLKNKYPNSKIYIQSILPVMDKATAKAPYLNNQRIGEFNNALKSMTKQENIIYIDLSSLIDITDETSFESDGEHPNYKFCPVWLNYIENCVVRN